MKKIILALILIGISQAEEKKAPALSKEDKEVIASLIIKAQNDALMAEQAQSKAKELVAEATKSFNDYNSMLTKVKKDLKAEGCEFDLVKQVFQNCKTEVAAAPVKAAEKK